MDDLLSLRRAAPSSLLDRFGRGNCGFRSMETRSFIRFARRRVAGHCRLCGRPDLARAGLARIVTTTADWFETGQDRARKSAFIAQIPPASSVVAPLPYLSHLAMREKLYITSLYAEGSQDSEPIILPAAVTNGFCAD